MKITCDGCSAKYSVADAKVRGRAFKIRCKRCGAAIVVRGESLAESAAWHVMVSGAEQGPMGIEQVRALLGAGSIDGESYVWKEGFAEWRALREVEELRSAELGADLFATSASPLAPEPSDEAASLTGTRSESSVLFSLSNLQALSAPATRTTAREGGSGLIDIRALASAQAPAAAPPMVDELLAIGSLASPLGPPVIVATPARSSRTPLVVAAISAAGAALAAAAVTVVLILGHQSETRAADRVQRGPIVRGPEAPLPEAVEPTAPPAAVTAVPDVATPAVEAPTVSTASTPEPRAHRPEAPRRPRRETEETAAPIAARPASDPPRDIDELLDLGARTERTPTREPVAPRGPATPSRSDIVSAMGAVAGAVRACGNGSRGLAPVRIVFRGESGRVTSAEVTAPSLSPEVRSCIARAARGARVPPFTQETFRVDYPFSL